ncbi:MAG: hypothetical protein LBC65_05100 [Oscillospiraceae bacterium]|nr:hypothetical protein [Oscillospiraceae bacterium]
MLFRRDIDPACSYCSKGCCIGDGEVLCRSRGVVGLWYKCRSFKYNPYNRIPDREPKLKLLPASLIPNIVAEPDSSNADYRERNLTTAPA